MADLPDLPDEIWSNILRKFVLLLRDVNQDIKLIKESCCNISTTDKLRKDLVFFYLMHEIGITNMPHLREVRYTICRIFDSDPSPVVYPLSKIKPIGFRTKTATTESDNCVMFYCRTDFRVFGLQLIAFVKKIVPYERIKAIFSTTYYNSVICECFAISTTLMHWRASVKVEPNNKYQIAFGLQSTHEMDLMYTVYSNGEDVNHNKPHFSRVYTNFYDLPTQTMTLFQPMKPIESGYDDNEILSTPGMIYTGDLDYQKLVYNK